MGIHVKLLAISIVSIFDHSGKHSKLLQRRVSKDKTLSKHSHSVSSFSTNLISDVFFSNAPQPVFATDLDVQGAEAIAEGCYRHIQKMFKELEDVRPFELLRTSRDRSNYLLTMEARIVALTSTHAAIKHREILELGFKYDNIIMEEAAQITEIESFIPLTLQHPQNDDNPLQRIVLIGDHHQNPPVIQNAALKQMEQSLFTRLVRLGVPAIQLDAQGRSRPDIANLYRWRYKSLTDLPVVQQNEKYTTANAGFRYPFQFINVEDFEGVGETSPSPHFIQNLGEAEYAVAIYQYMRLLGYPPETISILTTYAGQRALINDVLDQRCTNHPLFGLPATVTTVDKYQGDQNDCTLLQE
jgi:intron-binding protein aquarius